MVEIKEAQVAGIADSLSMNPNVHIWGKWQLSYEVVKMQQLQLI
jgi:hypothetical protein